MAEAEGAGQRRRPSAIDLSAILELSHTRLSNLLRERGCSEDALAKCGTVEDLYNIAPKFLTLPVPRPV